MTLKEERGKVVYDIARESNALTHLHPEHYALNYISKIEDGEPVFSDSFYEDFRFNNCDWENEELTLCALIRYRAVLRAAVNKEARERGYSKKALEKLKDRDTGFI